MNLAVSALCATLHSELFFYMHLFGIFGHREHLYDLKTLVSHIRTRNFEIWRQIQNLKKQEI
jgi:hypothetical protein